MKFCRWTLAALALALLAPGAACLFGQQADGQPSATMSAGDHAVVTARMTEITESAKIYGYDLGAGNWTLTQARCAVLPEVILLHYSRTFPDGAQSRFTAVVPRAAARVRIVPVLYHGATPFVPAEANPRNYALFNQLVQQNGGDAHGRLQLSGCYAELTGGDSGPLPERTPAIAGAPGPTLHLEPKSKTSSVTLASRSTLDRYQVWSVSFDSKGHVTKAAAEIQPAHSGGTTPMAAPEEQAQARPAAKGPEVEPGWKYIPEPPDPPSKLVPPAPQPPEKMMPN